MRPHTVLPIYFINLDDRTERRAHIEAQLGGIGLAGTRIRATFASEITPQQIARHCDLTSAHALMPKQLATSLSHLRCWQAIAAGDSEWALVLEDDGVLSPRLPEFLTHFARSELRHRLDVVQLETIVRRARLLPPIGHIEGGFALRPFRSTIYGGAAYLIAKSAAKRLLGRDDLFHQPIDLTLFRPFAGPGKSLRNALADPALCIQLNRVDGSDGVGTTSMDTPLRMLPPANAAIAIERMRHDLGIGIANAVDHVAHLSRGLTKQPIAFEGDPTQLRHGGSYRQVTET